MEKKNQNEQELHGSSNYELNSDAVEELAGADTGETPQYTQEELNKYRSRSKFHIPEPVKILFLKAWFSGAVCFFILWGLSGYVSNLIDMLFVLGIVQGMVTDILLNSTIRFMEKTPGANDKWLMFPKKGMMSFFLNLVYGCVIIYCVFSLYNGINTVITTITGDVENVPLGVEPILFGLFCMGFDMLFVGAKNLMKSIVRDAMEAAKGGNKK